VLHLAALVSVPLSISFPAKNFRLNVQATDIIARLCIEYKCPRLVFASSAAVYGDLAVPSINYIPRSEVDPTCPSSPYASSKLASEWMLNGYAASYGLEVAYLRYFNVYGPRQNVLSSYSGVLALYTDTLKKGNTIVVNGDGEQSRDFISVSDVSRANYLALTKKQLVNGSYNVCTGNSTSLNKVIEIYRKVYPKLEICSKDRREGDAKHSLGTASKSRRMLGFIASTSLEQGILDLIRKSQ
jgi:UDP-glucose 4-epimerase